MTRTASALVGSLLDAIGPNVTVDGESAFITDPVTGLVRNRVHAEVAKALIRRGDGALAMRLLDYIGSRQGDDGSWNEIHLNYDRPSALITAIIGDAFLEADAIRPAAEQAERAKDYVLSRELRPGYYLKSASVTADHLNVDATCGAFLARYGERYGDTDCREAAERAALWICDNMTGGFFPYTLDRGSYSHVFRVPCLHYQAVTLYYLIKINRYLRNPAVEARILEGTQWLAARQGPAGRFDWGESGLLFAYYLSGAYGFAYACYRSLEDEDPAFGEKAGLCLDVLAQNVRGLVLRWERDSLLSFPASLPDSIRTTAIGAFPLRQRLFRFGYASYRQLARRRYRDGLDDALFRFLVTTFRVPVTTIEPSANFPDLFMTSEVLDCLTYPR